VTGTRIRTLVVATGVAALLAACGTPQAGAAAVIGGHRISVSDLQSATEDAQAYVDAQTQAQGGQRTAVSQRQVLYLLAALPYIEQLATQSGVGVSQDDARAELRAWNVPNPSTAGVQVVQANAALAQLQQMGQAKAAQVNASITASLKQDHLQVNPRYGSFNGSVGRIIPGQPNWLPTPSAAANPPAAPSQ
jgi:hypothetical protein